MSFRPRGTAAAVRPRSPEGFTIVELLVAMTVLIVMVGILLTIVNQSGTIWKRTRGELGSYETARFGFNLITRSLSQSRMGVYTDYYPIPPENSSTSYKPTDYIRRSDLNFVIAGPQGTDFNQGNSIFFQAPLGHVTDTAKYGGLPGLMNTVGYYVTYGPDPNLPAFLKPYDRDRFRLMQFLAPAEEMNVYADRTGDSWYTDAALLNTNSRVIADNVILALFWPRLPAKEDQNGSELSSNYKYDSRTGANSPSQPATANQQPPLVQVTLVVVDETFFNRLPESTTPPGQITDCLAGLFTNSSVDSYTADLEQLEERLGKERIGYRVLSSMVQLRETKWSK